MMVNTGESQIVSCFLTCTDKAHFSIWWMKTLILRFFVYNIAVLIEGASMCTEYGTVSSSLQRMAKRFSEDFFCEMPKKFSKSHIPGIEMTFLAVKN